MTVNGRGADKRLFIVCVDDDPVVLLSFRRMIKSILPGEVEVLTATSGDQALYVVETVSSNTSNLILLLISDWGMPNLYGDDLFKIIHRKFPWIRLLMISAFPKKDAENRLEGIPHMYLTKPVTTPQLKDAIQTLIVEAHLGK